MWSSNVSQPVAALTVPSCVVVTHSASDGYCSCLLYIKPHTSAVTGIGVEVNNIVVAVSLQNLHFEALKQNLTR